MPLKNSTGLTLLEVLIVVAVTSIIAGIAVYNFPDMLRSWRLKDAANQMLEDVRDAQNEAMRIGDYVSIDSGANSRRFRQQTVFLVLDAAGGSYEAWQWIDDNDDGGVDATDNNGYPDNGSDEDTYIQIYSRSLPDGVSFSSGPASRSACTGAANTLDPSAPTQITFDNKGYKPCDGNDCIQFDSQGSINDKGNIYLTDDRNTWAINSLEPGFFRLCRWTGNNWD